MKLTSKKLLALATALSLGGVAYAAGPKAGGMGAQAVPGASGGHVQMQTQTRSEAREQLRTRTQAHTQMHTQDGQGLNDQWLREQAQAQNRFEMRTRTTTGSTQGE